MYLDSLVTIKEDKGGTGYYPTVSSGVISDKSSALYGKQCYYFAKESRGKITTWILTADGVITVRGNSFPGGCPSLDWNGQTSVLAYYEGTSAKCRKGSNMYATSETIGTNGEHIQSDKGLFAAWKNPPIQGIECAYFKDGSWTQENVLSSSSGLNYPNTALSWYHKKAYVFTSVCENGQDQNYLWLQSVTTDDMGFDGARVVQPNGAPSSSSQEYFLGYRVNKPVIVKWGCLSTADGYDHFTVRATYDYDNYPSCSWETIPLSASNCTKDAQGLWTTIWEPTTPSSHCRIKVTVDYGGGNTASDVSDYDFKVVGFIVTSPLTPSGGNPGLLAYMPGGSHNEIPWIAEGVMGLDTVVLELSRNGGINYSAVCGGLPYDSTLVDTVIADTSYFYHYDGVIDFTIPPIPTSNACLRLMAAGTTSDTAYSEPFFPFAVAPPGGYTKNTYSNQCIMSMNDDADKIGLVYTAQDADTATKLSVLYMESSDGIDFTAPDTIKRGRWPAFSGGACIWKNAPSYCTKDTLFYSYQLNDTFSTPLAITYTHPYADSGRFAPVGLLSENDTTHLLIQQAIATHNTKGEKLFSPSVIYLRFPETSPMTFYLDTIKIATSSYASYYDTSQIAGSLAKRGSTVYAAYDYLTNCYFTTITPPTHSEKLMGAGSQPQVSLSEGNITYSYLPAGDSVVIRKCRYVDDTAWFRNDTLHLGSQAEFLYSEKGLMYGIQHKDTSTAHLYVYDPLSAEFYLTETCQGYYPHPYIDNSSSVFSWINTYADNVDSSTTYLHTKRSDMNVILPALYLEAKDKRSPYTTFRDTCIHYTSVVVDSGTDSLKYTFPNLNDSKDYSVIVEFYTEEEDADTLEITLGSEVDTLVIPGNEYSWYEQNIASRTDTMHLKIRRISAGGFVPVARVIVRQRSSEGLFMSKGKPMPGPEKIVFCLFQPEPNPFTNQATIRFAVPYETNVSLKVYDITGRLVNTLLQGKVTPGVHSLSWEGKDNIGRKCSSGVYFVRFMAADYKASKKMVMIK
jgi:hypothetical protein